MNRFDGRKTDELRPVKIIKDFTRYAEGSVLIEWGNTKVLCNASVEESVPPFKKGSGEGWVTAEYSMLPRATATRNKRDINKLKLNQRSTEIQRLIGRALRAAVDFTEHYGGLRCSAGGRRHQNGIHHRRLCCTGNGVSEIGSGGAD